MLKGHVHSIETFGTVDGPGIRFVLFMQGCLLKCQYCHNPDTWGLHEGQEMTVEEVCREIEPYLSYYRGSGGGLTVSGGEPTLQYPFVAELFKEVKKRWNLHTALDSNGYNEPDKIAELLDYTDLVLLDLKHIRDDKHIALTGKSNERTLKMARWLSDHGKRCGSGMYSFRASTTKRKILPIWGSLYARLRAWINSKSCRITKWACTSGRSLGWPIRWKACLRRQRRKWRAHTG